MRSTSSRRRRPTSRAHRPRELREQRVSPDKSLGQHFLTDWGAARRIVEAASDGDVEAVVEVGPGLGVLTDRLIEAAPHLIAVEMDTALARGLRDRYDGSNRLTLVEADVLTTTPAQLLEASGRPAGARYGFVSNLPYNAGTAILRHFLESERPPAWLVVMLQREVAQAICAAPGELGLLGVSVQVYARPRRLFNLPARAFYPPPRVTSTVIRLDVLREPLIAPPERAFFFETVRAGFSTPRKRLRNSLANGLACSAAEAGAILEIAGIDPAVRPAQLRVEDWLRLSRMRAAGPSSSSPQGS